MSPISFSVSRFAVGGAVMLLLMYFQCYYDAKRAGEPFQFIPHIEKGDRIRLLLVSVFGATLAPWIGIEGLGLVDVRYFDDKTYVMSWNYILTIKPYFKAG